MLAGMNENPYLASVICVVLSSISISRTSHAHKMAALWSPYCSVTCSQYGQLTIHYAANYVKVSRTQTHTHTHVRTCSYWHYDCTHTHLPITDVSVAEGLVRRWFAGKQLRNDVTQSGVCLFCRRHNSTPSQEHDLSVRPRRRRTARVPSEQLLPRIGQRRREV